MNALIRPCPVLPPWRLHSDCSAAPSGPALRTMRKGSEVMLWLALAGVAFGWRRSVRLCHAPPRRLPVVQCAAVAELCKQRFGCAPGEARLVEEKLPAAPWFNLATANSRCDSVRTGFG